MDINSLLTSIVRNQLTGFLADKLNISEEQAATLVAVAIPILLAALSKNAKKSSEAQNISAALTEHNGSIFEDILASLGNPSTAAEGQKIIAHILGSKADKVTETIADQVDIKPSQASQALAMIAPVLMGALGAQQSQNQTSPENLSSALTSILGSLFK